MSDHSSVHSWLKNVEPSILPSLEAYQDTDQGDSNGGRSTAAPAKRTLSNLHPDGSGKCRPLKIRQGKAHGTRYGKAPLREVTGNVMSPVRRRPKDSLESEKDHPPSTPPQSGRGERYATRASNATEQYLEDVTPRAAPNPFPGPASQSDTHSNFSLSRSSTSASTARSKSPVKSMADLQMARRPTETHRMDAIAAVEAGGVLVHYPRLVQISRGEAVIPHHLQNFMKNELPEVDRPPKWAYTVDDDTVSAAVEEYQRTWGNKAKSLYEQALDCDQRGLTEANWNFKVHHPLLDLVVGNPKYGGMVEQMNITHARIQPKTLSPVHLSGDLMQSKMVDLAILLRLDPFAQTRLRNILQCSPKDSQSVNQTMQNPLREEPIAINIETKVPFSGEATADLQLAIWSGAGLLRIRGLLEMLEHAQEQIPTLPMLSLHGHDLHLSAIQERTDLNRVYGKLRIGSTDSILGIFQVIAGFEVLIDWANTDLRKFYEEKILAGPVS